MPSTLACDSPVWPLAGLALIDRILAVGRFIEEARRRLLKSRMACTRARNLMAGFVRDSSCLHGAF